MTRHKDPRGQDQKIAAALRADIMSGELPAGAQLPITQALMEQFGVANQTVQRAMQILKEEAFVVGRTGRGVFVRDATLQPVDMVAPTGRTVAGVASARAAEATQTAAGKPRTSRIVRVAEVVPPAQVRQVLGLDGDGTAAMRHRLLLLDDEPAELVWAYYPLAIAKGTALLRHARLKNGSATVLAELGYPPRSIVDRITWRPPTEEELLALELPAEVSVTRTLRVVYSDEDRPVAASIMVKSGHLHELRYSVPVG